MIAWPRRLERLALQIDPRIISNSTLGNLLQQALDIQKQSLTHLLIHGKFKLRLDGLDLRAFSCLEHLALCNGSLLDFSQFPYDKRNVVELGSRIFAPRLKSLLWVLPWWRKDRRKTKNFFSSKHENELRSLLETALNIKHQRVKTGEWRFSRVWVECTVMAPECYDKKARHNLQKDLHRIKALDDEFGPYGINVRHLPLLRPSQDIGRDRDMAHSLLDEPWSWDDNLTLPREY